MSALDASNDNAVSDEGASSDEVSISDDGSIALVRNDRDARAPAFVRAVATGFCVGARMFLAEMGDERARALLAVPAAPPNDRVPAAIPSPAAIPAEVMSADETAAFLGVDRNTVYDAAGRNEIPHRRIGKRLLFSRAQLVSWLGACKAAPVRNG
jgi:excisionase family DNA binding protein